MHLKVESSKFAETLNLGMKQMIKHEDTEDLYLSNMVYGGAVQCDGERWGSQFCG